MNELSTISEYREFKAALDTELRNQSEGFVRTGYLLKKARDTDILRESGYATVAEFAQAEYGLTKDIVSRYIAINDRYSVDGYSEYLQEKYNGYGVAKLQEMLTLPETVTDLMSAELTKREIQDIKRELKEEEQTTDIEVLLEGQVPAQESMSLLQKVLHQYFYEQREQFIRLDEVIERKLELSEAVEKILDVVAPSGIAVKTVRIQGVGRIMVSFKGKDNNIELLNVRTNEKDEVSWQQFINDMSCTFGGRAGVAGWESIYGEPFAEPEPPKEEKKPEVAPVQPVKQEEKPKIEPKIARSGSIEQKTERTAPVRTKNESITASSEEEQIPEQTELARDFPQYMPEPVIEEGKDQSSTEECVEVQQAENEQWEEYMNRLAERADKVVELAEEKRYDIARTHLQELEKILTKMEELSKNGELCVQQAGEGEEYETINSAE